MIDFKKREHHTPLLGALLCVMIVFGSAGCHGPTLVATPNLYAGSDENPFADVIPEFQSNLIKVIYATDRVATENEDGGIEYGYRRSRSVDIGHCTVAIGTDLSWEDLVSNSRTAQRPEPLPLSLQDITRVATFPESGTPPVLVDGELGEDPADIATRKKMVAQFHTALSERLAMTPRKEVFMFIHGYHNTFEDAAFRTAQLWHFLGREGVPLMYSWPAGHGGIIRGYNYDRESGEFTVYHLKQLLGALASCPDVEKVHIVAHSRGTDVLITALRELNIQAKAAGLDTGKHLKLENVILAAADLDWEVTGQRIGAERVAFVPQRFTIYLSQDDKALGMSRWLFGSVSRLGDVTLRDLTDAQKAALDHMPELNAIDVNVKTSFTGHGYFINNPAVLSDLILLLRDNRPPGAEHGRPLTRTDHGFWELNNGYPQPTTSENAADTDE